MMLDLGLIPNPSQRFAERENDAFDEVLSNDDEWAEVDKYR